MPGCHRIRYRGLARPAANAAAALGSSATFQSMTLNDTHGSGEKSSPPAISEQAA
jgi:hypothetical protein